MHSRNRYPKVSVHLAASGVGSSFLHQPDIVIDLMVANSGNLIGFVNILRDPTETPPGGETGPGARTACDVAKLCNPSANPFGITHALDMTCPLCVRGSTRSKAVTLY
jgi:hypothetical protein